MYIRKLVLFLRKMVISRGWILLRSVFILLPCAIHHFVSCKLILAVF